MKYIRITAINWVANFEDVNGSYYDRVAEISASSQDAEQRITAELIQKGWRQIQTKTGIRVFLNERHVVRLFPIWN